MGTHRITADVAAKIHKWKQAGKSATKIAGDLEAQLGIKLDRRSIDRFLARSHDASPPKPARPAPIARAPVPISEPSDEEPDEPVEEPTLDEVEALERRAKRLQTLLAGDKYLPVRDTAALNAELRQTFASIRRARAAKQSETHVLSTEAAATLARIKRFQEANKRYPTAVSVEETTPEDAPVPATTGTDPC